MAQCVAMLSCKSRVLDSIQSSPHVYVDFLWPLDSPSFFKNIMLVGGLATQNYPEQGKVFSADE